MASTASVFQFDTAERIDDWAVFAADQPHNLRRHMDDEEQQRHNNDGNPQCCFGQYDRSCPKKDADRVNH